MKILAFAASLRMESSNRRLIARAAVLAREAGAAVELVDFREFVCPYFDGDQEAATGIPEGAQQLGSRLRAADGLMIASPEYNYSIPGTLKNTLDWTSRIRPLPFSGCTGFLMGASNGPIGTNRGLWQVRIPLECLGVLLYPRMFGLPMAGQAFGDDGGLVAEGLETRLAGLIGSYVQYGSRLAKT